MSINQLHNWVWPSKSCGSRPLPLFLWWHGFPFSHFVVFSTWTAKIQAENGNSLGCASWKFGCAPIKFGLNPQNHKFGRSQMLAANRSLCVKFGVIEMQPHAGLWLVKKTHGHGMLIEHLQRATLNNDTSVGYTLWIPSTSLFMKDAASFKQVWWAFDPRALILVVRKSHIASRNQSHLTSGVFRDPSSWISPSFSILLATDVTCVVHMATWCTYLCLGKASFFHPLLTHGESSYFPTGRSSYG